MAVFQRKSQQPGNDDMMSTGSPGSDSDAQHKEIPGVAGRRRMKRAFRAFAIVTIMTAFAILVGQNVDLQVHILIPAGMENEGTQDPLFKRAKHLLFVNNTDETTGINGGGGEAKDNTNTVVDKRIEIQRPFMETTSRTFLDSMRDIERKYKPTAACDSWGGTKFMDGLEESAKSLLHNGTSSIVSYHNAAMDIYFAENVSVVLTMPPPSEHSNGDGEAIAVPSFSLEVDGNFIDGDARSRVIEYKMESTLTDMTMHLSERNGLDECTEYIEYPVMLVDNNVDTWNWWFFLKSILHHYIAVAVVQPKIAGDYKQEALRVMFALTDSAYSRSFVDAFEFLFSDRRGRDSRQVWHVPVVRAGNSNSNSNSGADDNDNGNDSNKKRYCFRKLLWSPGGSTGADAILVNQQHEHTSCFSSIVYSYAAHLKAALHIPTLPRPEKPRVVWVGRDPSAAANPTSWQSKRIVENQEEVIAYLRAECNKIGVEFIAADFYGDKKDLPFQEQALFVSRANVMIGMHGAGLNLFHFMPFNSVVVEIHRNTNLQMNSANFVNHVKEGKYISTNAQMTGTHLKKEPIWDTLKEAINEWGEIALV
jgi:hypothetical protein